MTEAPEAGRVEVGGPEIDPVSGSERSPLLVSILFLKLRPLWPWLVLAAVTFLGWDELRRIDLGQVRVLLRQSGPGMLLPLLAATALNLAVAGLYDVVALGPLHLGPRIAARWKIGVVSFSWSNFLTVGPLAGPALRFWLYRPLRVSTERAGSALTAILSSFSLGLLGWCAAAAVPLPERFESFGVRLALGIPAAALAAVVLHFLPRLPLAPRAVRQWEAGGLRLAAVPALDWLLAWFVFHIALQGVHGSVPLGTSFRAFFVGQLVGLVTLVPGGLGSADAYWLYSLAGTAGGHDQVLAALVLYRIVYYVVPWAFATLYLVGRLVRSDRRIDLLVRTTIASYTFLCGLLLLASAATPALAGRVRFLKESVPLAVVEISHGLSVLFGFLMLVISRGLSRGYRTSHRIALMIFLGGATTTFLKGLDFEEAILSLAAAAMLVVFRGTFPRPGRLRPSLEFVLSVGTLAIVFFVAIGAGAYGTQPDVGSVFSRFGYHAYEPRFLRSLLLLGGFLAIVVIRLAQGPPSRDPLPDEPQIGRALDDVRAYADSTNPLLVACGDKAFFRPPAGPAEGNVGRGFVAYRTAGRFLVAYSDPVCPEGECREMLASFLDHASSSDRDVILYQISASLLPVAHDFGFSFFKLGEEGIVELPRFDLKGNKAKSWRSAVNRVERDGGRFEIVEGEPLRAVLPELRAVSDAWLVRKRAREKSFSIGRFDELYLLRFPCALVRDERGRVAAFANVLEVPHAGEISVDLMRYRPADDPEGGLEGVMDYLFVKLILHAKERGLERFNLGMAPLKAVGEVRWARPTERLAHLFFRHGEQWYNYQGLRRFKEKFDPVWEPRYLAHPRPWDWPAAVAAATVLIAGGWRALLFSWWRSE